MKRAPIGLHTVTPRAIHLHGKERTVEHQLCRKPMITCRSFKITAILMKLMCHLRAHLLECKGKPRIRLIRGGQMKCRKEQPYDIGKIMIGAQIRTILQIADDMSSMIVHRRGKDALKGIIKRSSKCLKQIVGHKPVGDAYPHIHRAAPVYTELRWIQCYKIQYFIAELPRIDIALRFLCHPERAGKHWQMLHTGKFPGDLYIHPRQMSIGDLCIPSLRRPCVSGLKVHLPWNRIIVCIHKSPCCFCITKVNRTNLSREPFSIGIHYNCGTRRIYFSFDTEAGHTIMDATPATAQKIKFMHTKEIRQRSYLSTILLK